MPESFQDTFVEITRKFFIPLDQLKKEIQGSISSDLDITMVEDVLVRLDDLERECFIMLFLQQRAITAKRLKNLLMYHSYMNLLSRLNLFPQNEHIAYLANLFPKDLQAFQPDQELKDQIKRSHLTFLEKTSKRLLTDSEIFDFMQKILSKYKIPTPSFVSVEKSLEGLLSMKLVSKRSISQRKNLWFIEPSLNLLLKRLEREHTRN